MHYTIVYGITMGSLVWVCSVDAGAALDGIPHSGMLSKLIKSCLEKTGAFVLKTGCADVHVLGCSPLLTDSIV